MQVWNLLHAARWKYRMQKSRQTSPSGHHRTALSGYIFSTKARIDNRKKKLVKQQYVLHMSPQYGELQPTSSWDRSGSLRHPCKFQQVLHLGSITAQHLVVGVSKTLRRWTEGATYVRQVNHHVGHWPTFLVLQRAAMPAMHALQALFQLLFDSATSMSFTEEYFTHRNKFRVFTASATGQPTKPTQPFILSRLINEY